MSVHSPKNIRKYILVALLMLVTTGCAVTNKRIGVENRWRAPLAEKFVEGTTTQAEVLDELGPPSQIINLDEQLVFYYLLEKHKGKGLILLVYNNFKENITYDRAIFFFDKKGVLTEFSYSNE